MGKSKIEIIKGDITKQSFDCIVNAANEGLYEGSGVCGAIFQASGNWLRKECEKLSGCPTGEARITKAYNLNSQGIGWIIHAVGPVWRGGNSGEQKLLENAYVNSLKLAVNYKQAYEQQVLEALKRSPKKLEKEQINKIMEKEKLKLEQYSNNHPIKSIAFPSISTGIYSFPVEKATAIALRAIKNFLAHNNDLEKVTMVLFDDKTYEIYLKEMERNK